MSYHRTRLSNNWSQTGQSLEGIKVLVPGNLVSPHPSKNWIIGSKSIACLVYTTTAWQDGVLLYLLINLFGMDIICARPPDPKPFVLSCHLLVFLWGTCDWWTTYWQLETASFSSCRGTPSLSEFSHLDQKPLKGPEQSRTALLHYCPLRNLKPKGQVHKKNNEILSNGHQAWKETRKDSEVVGKQVRQRGRLLGKAMLQVKPLRHRFLPFLCPPGITSRKWTHKTILSEVKWSCFFWMFGAVKNYWTSLIFNWVT